MRRCAPRSQSPLGLRCCAFPRPPQGTDHNRLHQLLRRSGPYNHGWLYFPWEAAPTGEQPSLETQMAVTMSVSMRRPRAPFSVEHLRESRSLFGDFRRLGRLCDAAKPKTAAGCLRTPSNGRASNSEPKREEGYLLFAIALESAVLPTEHPELNYRLSRRVSALLTQKSAAESELRSQVGRLYGIRLGSPTVPLRGQRAGSGCFAPADQTHSDQAASRAPNLADEPSRLRLLA